MKHGWLAGVGEETWADAAVWPKLESELLLVSFQSYNLSYKTEEEKTSFLMNPELVKLDIINISNAACGEKSSFPLWFSERFDWHLQAMAAALAGDTCHGRGAWLAVVGADGRRV